MMTVHFFDRKPAAEKTVECEPHRRFKLWIYDLRTNKHFTLKENPLKRSDLGDFVACYNPKNRHERKESQRFKSFTYEELTKRDKLSATNSTSTSSGSKTKASKTALTFPIPTFSPPK